MALFLSILLSETARFSSFNTFETQTKPSQVTLEQAIEA
jgi:hypothetical protein